jgi:hypothetical protein
MTTLPRATTSLSKTPEGASELVCSGSGALFAELLPRIRRSRNRYPSAFFHDVVTRRFKNSVLQLRQRKEKPKIRRIPDVLVRPRAISRRPQDDGSREAADGDWHHALAKV